MTAAHRSCWPVFDSDTGPGRAFETPGRGVVDLAERLEQLVLLLGLDTDPAIDDLIVVARSQSGDAAVHT